RSAGARPRFSQKPSPRTTLAVRRSKRVTTSPWRTGWLETVRRLPFTRTKPAAARAAAAGRVRTIRACHSHLSIRWRSSSWVQVLKTGLCHSVPASALAQRAWQTANSGPVCRGRRQCCRKALRNTAPVRHDQPADRDHGVAARGARCALSIQRVHLDAPCAAGALAGPGVFLDSDDRRAHRVAGAGRAQADRRRARRTLSHLRPTERPAQRLIRMRRPPLVAGAVGGATDAAALRTGRRAAKPRQRSTPQACSQPELHLRLARAQRFQLRPALPRALVPRKAPAPAPMVQLLHQRSPVQAIKSAMRHRCLRWFQLALALPPPLISRFHLTQE